MGRNALKTRVVTKKSERTDFDPLRVERSISQSKMDVIWSSQNRQTGEATDPFRSLSLHHCFLSFWAKILVRRLKRCRYGAVHPRFVSATISQLPALHVCNHPPTALPGMFNPWPVSSLSQLHHHTAKTLLTSATHDPRTII